MFCGRLRCMIKTKYLFLSRSPCHYKNAVSGEQCLYAGNQLGEERAKMRVYEGARELRIACKHDDLLPSFREYDPQREFCAIECGIPVKHFCRGIGKYEEDGFFMHAEDGVCTWRILLTADVSMAEIPVEMIKKQDMILVYQTSTEKQLVECVYPLFPLQKGDSDVAVSNPAIFCFATVDAAKEFIRFIGWQMLVDVQVIDLDFDDVIKAFASQQENILCISKKVLVLQEELSEKDAEAQGALFIFRGDDLSLYEVCEKVEKLCSVFHEGTNIIWIIDVCQERSVTALLAKKLIDPVF